MSSKRLEIVPVCPSLEDWMRILFLAATIKIGSLWSHVWTYCDPAWLEYLVREGYLAVVRDGEYVGMGYAGVDGPVHVLTPRGKQWLEDHRLVMHTFLAPRISQLKEELRELESFC